MTHDDDIELEHAAHVDAGFPHQEFWDCITSELDADADPIGLVQIVCADAGTWPDRVAPLVRRGLDYRFAESGERVMRRVRIISSAGVLAEDVRSALVEAVARQIARADGTPPPAAWLASLASIIDVDAAVGLRAIALATLMKDAQERTIVAVLSAAEYMPPPSISPAADGDELVVSEDEAWCRRLAATCELLEPIAEERGHMLVLDTGHDQPVEPGVEVLTDGGRRGVLGVWRSSPARAAAERLPAWTEMVNRGQVGVALREVAEFDGLGQLSKATLRIQLLYAAGMPDQALREIGELPVDTDLDPGMAAKLALIAARAGGTGTAVAMLRRFADRLAEREDLQNAALAAERIGDDPLLATLSAKLHSIHPDSTVLAQLRYKDAIRRGDHLAAAAELEASSGREAFARTHRMLANAFTRKGEVDYESTIAQADEEGDGRLARVEAARHALKAGRPIAAVEMLTTAEAERLGAGTLLLTEAVEQLVLGSAETGRTEERLDAVETGFVSIVQRMARDTQNKPLRARLLNVIEPSVSGHVGTALALAALSRAQAGTTIPTPNHPSEAPVPFGPLVADPTFKAALKAWFGGNHAVRLGHSDIDPALIPGNPDGIAEGIIEQLAFEAPRIQPAGIGGIQMMLAVGTAVARHARRPDMDMEMIRVACSGLATNAAAQHARDIVETMTEIAESPHRRRLAWFGLADVYARCRRNDHAALYAAAGLFADDRSDETQLWHEILVLQRIHRDLGRTAEALAQIDAAEALLTSMGRIEDYGHRLGTMRLQTSMMATNLRGTSTEDLTGLLEDAVRNGEEVLLAQEEPGIVGLLLAQLLREASERHLATSAEASATLAALATRSDGNIAMQIEALGRDVPTVADLRALAKTSGGQRYSDDLGTDARAAALAARRALAGEATLGDRELAVLALELTADRAIARPGWLDTKEPPDQIEDPAALLAIASEISLEGTAVLLAGLDADDALIHVTVESGVVGLPVREPVTNFSRQAFDEWRARDLFNYGLIRLDRDVFEQTTDRLRWSKLPAGRTLVVTDTRMRSLPATLLRQVRSDAPAGLHRVTAAAPSLTWLATSRRMTSLGDGRRVAWIPGDPKAGGTLAFIASISEELLAEHGFALDRRERLPDDFEGASLAVVVAHGGLNEHGGAFQVVKDENALTVSASDLARSLHNVGVVLLFVCSGGRSDSHPAAEATLGLPRELLDQGVQAVVGSPWPLDSQVPARWLPYFLRRWDDGERLADAVHEANLDLQGKRDDLAQSLAMNVFGNPDVRYRRM